jgi:epoxyqueuosine reductase
VIIPPIYAGFERIRMQVEKNIGEILAERGYSWARTNLPLKLLAVRTGLAKYGRNNVCYVKGMGSFLRLVAVYSDMPCTEDSWQELKMMENCKEGHSCSQACQSGAIASDRFLLRAERCITYHNEKPANIPFPSWIDSRWHNSVIGCSRCQTICPQNRRFIKFEVQEEFSEQEIAMLLKKPTTSNLPAKAIEKLEKLGLTEELSLLPRNLEVLFRNTATT